MDKKLLSNIFNSIKNEELSIYAKDVLDERNKAVQTGQIDSSSYIYAQINLAKNCVNTVYKKILEKLKTDKLNHFIKKNSSIFIEFIDALINEVYGVIETETARSNSIEESDFLYKTYKKPLLEMKNDIIEQWNNEAIIQAHIKKQEGKKQFSNRVMLFIITIIASIIASIIAGVVLNQYNHQSKKPAQTIIQKEIQREVQIIPSEVVEKVKNSPEARQKASEVYKIFENFDGNQLREFIKALFLKFS